MCTFLSDELYNWLQPRLDAQGYCQQHSKAIVGMSTVLRYYPWSVLGGCLLSDVLQGIVLMKGRPATATYMHGKSCCIYSWCESRSQHVGPVIVCFLLLIMT
jgi:hypothetical protein